MIISKTPLRISFFGGGTDYPSYYNRNGGSVIGTTINKYVYISVNKLSGFFDHNFRIAYSQTEFAKFIDEIKHPSIRECLRFKKLTSSLDIHVFSDLPAKTGLGSSSSFTVGFLNCLNAIEGKMSSKMNLAKEACIVEQNFIKERVGSQDQHHASVGGFNIFEFSEKEVKQRPIVTSEKKLHILNEHMLVFYTGLTRYANEILTEQISKTEQKDNDSVLQEMRELVNLAEEIISHQQDSDFIKSLGELMKLNWQLKKKLSSKISNSLIDTYYDIAINSGAYGGKICGAGGGGFLIFLAPIDAHHKIRLNLKDLMEVNFKFEDSGSSIIYMRD